MIWSPPTRGYITANLLRNAYLAPPSPFKKAKQNDWTFVKGQETLEGSMMITLELGMLLYGVLEPELGSRYRAILCAEYGAD